MRHKIPPFTDAACRSRGCKWSFLIKQGKTQAERMKMLHELAVQQMTMLSRLDVSNLPSGEEMIKHENFG